MKKVLLFSLLCLSVFIAGCDSEKTLVFNKPYDEVFTKTIQFIAQKGWNIGYQDKQAKTIIAVLKSEVSSSSSGNVNPYGYASGYSASSGYSDTIRFIFTVNSSTETTVIASAKAQINTVVWNTDQTIHEYSDYINGIVSTYETTPFGNK
jgi:hypothetical protein